MNYIAILFLLLAALPLNAAVILESPVSGFTTSLVIRVRGRVTTPGATQCQLIHNGVAQRVALAAGAFNFRTVPSPGLNTVVIRYGNETARVSFFARVPERDIKVVLSWDTNSYTDLWVTDPKGERCYWAQTVTSTGGNLVYDDATFAPQVYTMAKAIPGTYTVAVQYYSSWDHPITRFTIDVILYEGTPREERQRYQYVATKPEQIYQVTEFSIEP